MQYNNNHEITSLMKHF